MKFTNSSLVSAPVLFIILTIVCLIVDSETNSIFEISLLLYPNTVSLATSCSLGVRLVTIFLFLTCPLNFAHPILYFDIAH